MIIRATAITSDALMAENREYFSGDTGAWRKTEVIAEIIRERWPTKPIGRILVVGTGNGEDSRCLSKTFDADVDGIDLNDYFERKPGFRVTFTPMDACDLQFPDATFDFVFSFHALEHIPDYERAIAEMRRVLKPDGLYCIGTPNRTRILGYVGVAGYPFRAKAIANLRDWGIRLRGRFRNEFGAHAGYTSGELLSICAAIGSGQPIQGRYYAILYKKWPLLIGAIRNLRLGWCGWPSVYIAGTRQA
jgi:ubiquinone/menaquinone biosynthesis C-methylase UbiE